MATKFNFKNIPSSTRDNEPSRSNGGHGPCEVYGCPKEGHIYTGKWNCRYHHGVSGDHLAKITSVLNNHEFAFKWHEKLLQSTIVDSDIGDIARRAPRGLEVLKNENYVTYKARIFKQIENMLKNG